MNTNMTRLEDFQKYTHPCALDESSGSIGRVNGPSLSLTIELGPALMAEWSKV